MLLYAVVLAVSVISISSNPSVEDIDTNLVPLLRDDANLDLSEDNEYEDLRAELLASHTVLAKLVEKELEPRKEKASRRSLSNTPCWNLGGVCINYKLCVGNKYLSEVPGCKDKMKVCCFVWNKYNVRDMSDKGFNNLAMPWSSLKTVYGGGGGVIKIDRTINLPKKKKLKNMINDTRLPVIAINEMKIKSKEKSSEGSAENERKQEDKERKDKPIALIIRTNK